MKRFLPLAMALAAAACSPAPVPAPTKAAAETTQMSPDELVELRKASAQVLFWDQDTRSANFRRMDALFPGTTAEASPSPRALPKGAPLPFDEAAIDAFMKDQNVAGLMMIQDGKVRLERYGLGMTPDDRWTSFSVAKSFTSTLVGAAIADGVRLSARPWGKTARPRKRPTLLMPTRLRPTRLLARLS